MSRADRSRSIKNFAFTTAAILASDEILALFAALLRIAQIEGGARRAAFAPVDLAELLRQLRDMLGPVADDAGHELVLTAPGIPMLFQGQEFLEDGWFQDSVPLDWHKSETFSGLVRMYRDLIHLRLNRSGCTRGLSGSGLNTFHENQADNVIAYHRWHQGGPGDDVVVVVNLSHLAHENYKLGFPSTGTWRLRLNSDASIYSRAFGNQACSDVMAKAELHDEPQGPVAVKQDGFPATGTIAIGPYSVLVFSQDPI